MDGEQTTGSDSDLAAQAAEYGTDSQLGGAAEGPADGILEPLAVPLGDPERLCFSPDGARLAYTVGWTVVVAGTAKGDVEHLLVGHRGPVTALAFDPSGQVLATGGADTVIRLWSVADGSLTGELPGIGEGVSALAYAPAGSADAVLLASGGAEGTVVVWDTEAREQTDARQVSETPIVGLVFSGDGATVATISEDEVVGLWSVPALDELGAFAGEGTTDGVAVAFTPDGTNAIVAAGDGTAVVWDLVEGEELRVVGTDVDDATTLALNADGTELAMRHDEDLTVSVWALTTDIASASLVGHADQVTVAAFAPNRAVLATAALDHALRLWDLDAASQDVTLTSTVTAQTGLAFGAGVLATAAGGEIWVWDPGSRARTFRLDARTNQVTALAFGPDGTTLITGSEDGVVLLCDLGTDADTENADRGKADTENTENTENADAENAAEPADLAGRDEDGASSSRRRALDNLCDNTWFTGVAIDPGGRLAAAVGQDRVLRLWDLEADKPPRRIGVGGGDPRSGLGWPNAVAFLPDGSRIVVGSDDGAVRSWDVRSGREKDSYLGHVDGITSIAVAETERGDLLASGCRDGSARIWTVRGGKELLALDAHDAPVNAVAFAPDADVLATASADGTAALWSVADGTELARLRGHLGEVTGVAFDLDGAVLATASTDATVRLWDAVTFAPLAALIGGPDGWLSVPADGAAESAGESAGEGEVGRALWTRSGDGHWRVRSAG